MEDFYLATVGMERKKKHFPPHQSTLSTPRGQLNLRFFLLLAVMLMSVIICHPIFVFYVELVLRIYESPGVSI